ncbi:NmrA family NAD(P)-binding protein [Sinorhizobium medicae]|uniref:NmrA family NAD(P)-binding protein n=1 Tax=Sinorhizobium medicae TaxID=110321 RepID=UPI0003FDB47F|nr:NmrA family NAD(P)-binding protein [Sinorhizobium medicae]MBO1944720.1 NAD(P)H-binding protein [Sinorhizobium medicae]MDX0426761.1 NAD(P)H-binding protein [Sinorhizobium medicae]MDX0499531.1 NAD(P)H-binding protein [Sinorhizobium medicae]MDX0528629.1 NAD(P)H-binding protein [Sinorhizobium medicae]MDX0537769.1 NAD(P)H-binding protein [Sinorhizobium medicae]
MHIIMGGTGHVGSATAANLLKRGEAVAILTRHADRAGEWRARGAEIIEANAEDVPSLCAAFRRGRRAFLLNPPADTTKDTDTVERRTAANILAALEGSGLEKVVAASTGGAQPGNRIGDLNVLWELEEGLRRQSIPAAINRGAYYMSNWDGLLDVVRRDGVLPTMFPEDTVIPMVAPRDLGEAAAERLLSSVNDVGVWYVEGPERYSPRDVARAFSLALDQPVRLAITPRDQWKQAFLCLGFSEPAAASYTRMTEVSVDSGFDLTDDPWCGSTSLDSYIRELVARSGTAEGG